MTTLNLGPQIVDLAVRADTDVSWDIRFVDADGAQVNKVGKTYAAKITTATSATAVVTLTVDTSEAMAGQLTLSGNLSALTAGADYRWVLNETTGGQEIPELAGPVVVSAAA